MKRLLISIFLPALIFFSGCSKTNRSPDHRAKPKIIVSLPPYETLATTLGGDNFEIHTLISPGTDPHTYEMPPRQLQQLQGADAWFWTGDPVEEKMIRVYAEHNPHCKLINLSNFTKLYTYDQDTLFLGQTSHPGHNHSHEDIDYHIWMSPQSLISQIPHITAVFKSLLPERIDQFEAFSAQTIRHLTELDDQITHALSQFHGSSILVSHPAYGYFCKAYQINQISIETEGKEPGVKDITDSLAKLEGENIRAVITQPQHNMKGAQLFAEQLRRCLVVIDPYSPEFSQTFLRLEETISKGSEGATCD